MIAMFYMHIIFVGIARPSFMRFEQAPTGLVGGGGKGPDGRSARFTIDPRFRVVFFFSKVRKMRYETEKEKKEG